MPDGRHASSDSAMPTRAAADMGAPAVWLAFAPAEAAVLRSWAAREPWALDHGPDQGGLAPQLALLAAQLTAAAPLLHHAARELGQLLASLGSARCQYALRYVGQHNLQFQASLAALIAAAGPQDPALAALGRRCAAFSRARTLASIFSGTRLQRIHTIMESYTDE